MNNANKNEYRNINGFSNRVIDSDSFESMESVLGETSEENNDFIEYAKTVLAYVNKFEPSGIRSKIYILESSLQPFQRKLNYWYSQILRIKKEGKNWSADFLNEKASKAFLEFEALEPLKSEFDEIIETLNNLYQLQAGEGTAKTFEWYFKSNTQSQDLQTKTKTAWLEVLNKFDGSFKKEENKK